MVDRLSRRQFFKQLAYITAAGVAVASTEPVRRFWPGFGEGRWGQITIKLPPQPTDFENALSAAIKDAMQMTLEGLKVDVKRLSSVIDTGAMRQSYEQLPDIFISDIDHEVTQGSSDGSIFIHTFRFSDTHFPPIQKATIEQRIARIIDGKLPLDQSLTK